MAKRIELSAEERGNVVLRMLRKDSKASDLARELSISEPTLYKWRETFLKAGVASLERRGARDEEQRGIAREMKEQGLTINELTVANRILKKLLGTFKVSDETRDLIEQERKDYDGRVRLTETLKHLDLSSSTWYRKPVENPKPRGRPRKSPHPEQVEAIRRLCEAYPFWGYKRIAFVARRDLGSTYNDNLVYKIMEEQGLLRQSAVDTNPES